MFHTKGLTPSNLRFRAGAGGSNFNDNFLLCFNSLCREKSCLYCLVLNNKAIKNKFYVNSNNNYNYKKITYEKTKLYYYHYYVLF